MFCFTSGNLYLQDGEGDAYRCIGIGTRTAMNGGAVPNSDVVPCHDGWKQRGGLRLPGAGAPLRLCSYGTNVYHEPVEVRLHWSEPSRRAALLEEAAALAATVDVPLAVCLAQEPQPLAPPAGRAGCASSTPVARKNPRTVVVLNSGDPVAMPWLEEVAAVLEMWYPGQEGGYATADVLLGRADAGGRLPVTFPVRLEDTAPHAPGHPERCAPCGKEARDDLVAGEARTAHFTEGIYVGYRWLQKEGIRPLFPFGHGLSYTRFALEDAQGRRTGDGGAEATCMVRNIGGRAGVCVLQAYLAAPEAAPEGIQFAKTGALRVHVGGICPGGRRGA